MNIHYTIYKEYELNATEGLFRHRVRALIRNPSESETAAEAYVGQFESNEFWLERSLGQPLPFTPAEILGRCEYADNKLTVQTWTRIKPLVNWLFMLGIVLQFLWIAMVAGRWESRHYFIGMVALAQAVMYFLLIMLVKEDAKHFEKVVATLIKEQTEKMQK